MSDEFLVIARLCLLALIYLTFLCVATALWANTRAEQPPARPVSPKSAFPKTVFPKARRAARARASEASRAPKGPRPAVAPSAGRAPSALTEIPESSALLTTPAPLSHVHPRSSPAAVSGLARAARPTLVRLEGDRPGTRSLLTSETTIGRDSGCLVRIDDPLVSKLHARVWLHESGWVVEDLGSTNGTLLNGAPLAAPALLGVGDRLQVGYTVVEAAAETAAEMS